MRMLSRASLTVLPSWPRARLRSRVKWEWLEGR